MFFNPWAEKVSNLSLSPMQGPVWHFSFPQVKPMVMASGATQTMFYGLKSL